MDTCTKDYTWRKHVAFKNPSRFSPDIWPTYFKSAKGCKVRDLDNNVYIDFSTMGVGTNVLGYGHPKVDLAVKQTVKKGNISTLNCPEESIVSRKINQYPSMV